MSAGTYDGIPRNDGVHRNDDVGPASYEPPDLLPVHVPLPAWPPPPDWYGPPQVKPTRPDGFAVAGIVLGVIALIVGMAVVGAVILLFSAMNQSASNK